MQPTSSKSMHLLPRRRVYTDYIVHHKLANFKQLSSRYGSVDVDVRYTVEKDIGLVRSESWPGYLLQRQNIGRMFENSP